MMERLYRSLSRIRRVESQIADVYPTDKIKSPAEILSSFVDSRLRLLYYTDAKARIWTEAGIAVVSFFEWGFTEQLLVVAMQEYIEKSVGSFKNSEEN